MASQASLLLQKQLKDLCKHPVDGFSAGLVDDKNIFEWSVTIIGPPDTLYEGGFFNAIMTFPQNYPNSPPTVRFTSDMWHPNVYSDGRVCISILHPPGDDPSGYELASERWTPVHTLPPQMNLARSQLQCYGEIVYSFDGHDLLGECSRRDKPIERLKSVVTWYISTLRPLIFGLAPYNPVIGETHHVSNGHINVLVEQISHHPPVSALHATHEKENVDVLFCQYFTPKFRGAYVEVEVKGRRVVKLLNHKETYEMNQPKLLMAFLPAMGAHWAGKIVIKCPETGLAAELQLLADSFLSRFTGNNKRAIKGKIFESSSRKQLYDIFGHWDRTVTAKNTKTGQLEVIYKASENIAKLKTPIVKNLQEVSESESAVVWGEVSEGIMTNDWEKAREAKRDVEEKQRESLRKREASGQSWIPKHFSVARAGKDWDCVPLQPTVPQAPIVIPL